MKHCLAINDISVSHHCGHDGHERALSTCPQRQHQQNAVSRLIIGLKAPTRPNDEALVFGLASFVFVISHVVIRRPAPTPVDFRSGRGWHEESARTSRIPVDDARARNKLQAEAKRPKNNVINSTTPRRLYSEDCKAALEDKPTLIYRARSRGAAGMPYPNASPRGPGAAQI